MQESNKSFTIIAIYIIMFKGISLANVFTKLYYNITDEKN